MCIQGGHDGIKLKGVCLEVRALHAHASVCSMLCPAPAAATCAILALVRISLLCHVTWNACLAQLLSATFLPDVQTLPAQLHSHGAHATDDSAMISYLHVSMEVDHDQNAMHCDFVRNMRSRWYISSVSVTRLEHGTWTSASLACRYILYSNPIQDSRYQYVAADRLVLNLAVAQHAAAVAVKFNCSESV
jgi:hypothetical protein